MVNYVSSLVFIFFRYVSVCILAVIFITNQSIANEICLPNGINSAANSPKSQLVIPEFKKSGKVFIFFNGSKNMLGFVSAASDVSQSSNSNYAKLVSLVPDVANQIGTATRYHKYRNGLISPISGTQIDQVTNPSFYKACSVLRKRCDESTRQLNSVFEIIQNNIPREALTVITTDLNLTSEEVRDRMPGTLGHKIIALFRKGMAFGLYVLKSDYKGSINGLPGGIPYNAASARPVYLLLVGPVEKIIAFRKALKQSFSKKAPRRQEKFWLFTDKIIKNQITEQTFEKEDYSYSKGAKKTVLMKGLSEIPQFLINKKGGQVNFQAQLSQIKIPETLSFKPEIIKQDLWMQKTNKGACTKRWLKFKKSRDISSFNLQNDKIDLTFFANQAEMRKLPPRRNYFLSFSIKANKVALSEEDLDWLKDWSFDKTSYDEVVNKKAPFFPTLNLARFVNFLTAVSQDTFEGGTILRYNSVFSRK